MKSAFSINCSSVMLNPFLSSSSSFGSIVSRMDLFVLEVGVEPAGEATDISLGGMMECAGGC